MDIKTAIDVALKQESPYIEGNEALFTYSGKADTVFIAGDYNRWELVDKMLKMEGRDVWYALKKFPSNARFDYKYIVDGNWITDPSNQNTTPSGSGFNSTLIMPEYKSDYEQIIRQDVPRGSVIHNLEYHSNYLNVSMRYHVYIPAGYKKGETSQIIYALDGSDYLNFSSINLVLDYMMHKGEIPRSVVVLVDPHDRNKEYTIYKPYYNYFIHELLPFVEKEYMGMVKEPERAVIGVSWGGLTAIYLAVSSPGMFNRVLSQSGSFWPKDWLIFHMIKEYQVSGIYFCLQTGTIEDTEEMNDAMYDILVSKGCQVDYVKYAESHSWGNWKGHLNEGLKKLYSGFLSV